MRAFFKYFFPLILVTHFSCIDPFEAKTDSNAEYLIVEGMLTTKAKSHEIRITRSSRFITETFMDLNRPVTGARVFISDEFGAGVILIERGNGYYDTPADYFGEIGKKYTLEIVLADGTIYSSFPEEIKEVPKVDSVTYNTVNKPTEQRYLDEIGVEVYAHFQDPPEEENYYFWRPLESYYMVVTEPEQYYTPVFYEPPRHPWPLECCNVCYDSEIPFPYTLITHSDRESNGLYQKRMMTYIIDDGLRFKDTYRLDLLHLSITENAYRYLRLVNQQRGLSGSVFDLPPANIRGNMANISNPEEQVLGYFFACDEEFIRTYIKRSQLESPATPVLVPQDCRNKYFNEYPDPFRPNPDPLPVDPPDDWDPWGF